MDIVAVLITVAVMSVLGAVLATALAFAGKIFEVKKDERIEKIIQILPGVNCGGCGYTGCEKYAEAVVKNGEEVNLCTVGGGPAVDSLSVIMGVNAEKKQRKRAQVMCRGTCEHVKMKYDYVGLDDCFSVSKLGNGPKECRYGCIGLGTCVKACIFGAIKIKDGLAVVDYDKCRACGVCVNSCPQGIIRLVPYDSSVWVCCSSGEKASVTREVCDTGCIGCGTCKRVCPENAIELENNVAVIDYSRCTGCGLCAEKCPRKIICMKEIRSEMNSGKEGDDSDI